MRNGSGIYPHTCVLVDLNTQRAFFDPDGDFAVVGAEQVTRNLRRVIAWIKRNQAPVVSSLDINHTVRRNVDHRDNRREPSGPCAQNGCATPGSGQMKLGFTLLPNRVFIAGDNTLAVETNLFDARQQVIFPQRSTDLFANPKADRFLTQIKTEEFLVFGGIAELEVKALALGLLVRHHHVTVIKDACGAWSQPEADLAMRQMEAKGANIITVDELSARKLPRRWRYTTDNLVRAFRTHGAVRSATMNGSRPSLTTQGMNDRNGTTGANGAIGANEMPAISTTNRADSDAPAVNGAPSRLPEFPINTNSPESPANSNGLNGSA